MIKALFRKLFFSVPSLKNLSEAEKLKTLKELEENYQKTFNKDYQQQLRLKKDSFSREQNEQIQLILEQLLKLNTFEILALRKLIINEQDSEYSWPLFSRPNESANKVPLGQEIKKIGIVNSSAELIKKITIGGSEGSSAKTAEVQEEVKEVVKEKTTFNLVLTGFDSTAKVKFIKCIKDIMGLGLKESKDKVEESLKGPVVLFKSVSKESHGKVLDQLLAAGGQAEFL